MRKFEEDVTLSQSEIDSINWQIDTLQDKNKWLTSILEFKTGSLEYKLERVKEVVKTLVEASVPYSFPDREQFVEHKINAIMIVAEKEHSQNSNSFLSCGDKIKYILSHIKDDDGNIEDISARLNVGMIQGRVLDICVRTIGERNSYLAKTEDEIRKYILNNQARINHLKSQFEMAEKTDLSFLSDNKYQGA